MNCFKSYCRYGTYSRKQKSWNKTSIGRARSELSHMLNLNWFSRSWQIELLPCWWLAKGKPPAEVGNRSLLRPWVSQFVSTWQWKCLVHHASALLRKTSVIERWEPTAREQQWWLLQLLCFTTYRVKTIGIVYSHRCSVLKCAYVPHQRLETKVTGVIMPVHVHTHARARTHSVLEKVMKTW